VLLRDIAVTLDRIEPLDPPSRETLTSAASSAVAALPMLGAVLSAAAVPLVLVLDDLHLPAGSQLAVGSRGEPPLPLARLRAEGRVLEVGPDDLAMGQQEARSLLEQAGLDVGPAGLGELVRRTEGWPVALRLAASSSRARGRDDAATLTGDDRFLTGCTGCTGCCGSCSAPSWSATTPPWPAG
jgi:LuxR family transcriptional regulator, maltose regulon positive regulatory protein